MVSLITFSVLHVFVRLDRISELEEVDMIISDEEVQGSSHHQGRTDQEPVEDVDEDDLVRGPAPFLIDLLP